MRWPRPASVDLSPSNIQNAAVSAARRPQPGDPCPKCQHPLIVESDPPPWCERCEWNLDRFTPARGGWLYRSLARLDGRAGYRADRRLVAEAAAPDDGRVRPTVGFVLLGLLSLVLVVLLLAALAAGVWLVVTGDYLWPVVAGIALIALAYGLRPRLGRVKRALRGTYRITPEQAPALHTLIHRIADAASAPRPDIVAFDEDWNASAAVIGIRRTRVLILGVPLMVAIHRQELVALLGHELGHLRYEDSGRSLLTQPALTVFGTASRAVRPRRSDAMESGLAGIVALFYLAWKIIGGVLSWLLFIVHLGLNVVGSRERRRAELRADLLSARVAGTDAALAVQDRLALLPMLTRVIQPNRNVNGALGDWRQAMDTTMALHRQYTPRLRQLSIRTQSSLLASHPAPGRRHQLLASLPGSGPSIRLTDAESERLDAELRPYVEVIRKRLAEYYEL
jgi:Zn-dependent protease with chaperone function